MLLTNPKVPGPKSAESVDARLQVMRAIAQSPLPRYLVLLPDRGMLLEREVADDPVGITCVQGIASDAVDHSMLTRAYRTFNENCGRDIFHAARGVSNLKASLIWLDWTTPWSAEKRRLTERLIRSFVPAGKETRFFVTYVFPENASPKDLLWILPQVEARGAAPNRIDSGFTEWLKALAFKRGLDVTFASWLVFQWVGLPKSRQCALLGFVMTKEGKTKVRRSIRHVRAKPKKIPATQDSPRGESSQGITNGKQARST